MTKRARHQIRYVDPATLIPDPDNPRDIDPGEYQTLRAGLTEFGFVEPIIVNTRTGWTVGGHQRTTAAIEEGFAEVPILEIDLDPDRARALNVLLNNPKAQGRYNKEALLEYLSPLEQTALLELTGFTFDDIQRIQLDIKAPSTAGRTGDTPPPPDTPKTKIGQTWELGPHILHIGDARDPDAYAHGPDEFGLCITDPPYAVGYEGRTDDKLTIIGDEIRSWADYHRFLYDALVPLATRLNGALYLFHSMTQAPAVHSALEDAHYHVATTIAWVKNHFVMGRGDYHYQWEPAIYAWPEGAARHWIGDRNQANVFEHADSKKARRQSAKKANAQTDVWRHNRPAANREHPTMKPISLLEHAIRNSSLPGAWVVDPYGGSGSTLVAADNLGRNCYMIELDPRYADVIIDRWKSLDPANKAKKRPTRQGAKK